jgi:hypothetical protein
LNDLNCYVLFFAKEHPNKLEQDEINRFLDQAKTRDPKLHEFMANTNIKHLENLEKIMCNNSPAVPPVDNEKSVTDCLGKPFRNRQFFNVWCNYCGKRNHKKADCRENARFKGEEGSL